MRERNGKKASHSIRRIFCFDLAALLVLTAGFLATYDWIPSGKFERTVSVLVRLTATEPPATPLLTATPSPVPTPTPSTTPTPLPTPVPGDFSATFPDYNTGERADYTCQTDQYRIAIEETSIGDCVVFIADIYVKDIHQIQTAFASNELENYKYQGITDMAQRCDAIFAVSGDYCTVRSSGIIIRNGELVRDEDYDDLCVLLESGELATYKKGEVTAKELMAANAWQTWSFGPPLLKNGAAIEINHSLSRLNPRCAIGYYEPGHYCFIIADGRQKYYSIGITLTDLSQLCENLGLKVAYNLDGGMTSAMVFGNERVNQPPNGGRRVGDIIYIKDLFSNNSEVQSDEG